MSPYQQLILTNSQTYFKKYLILKQSELAIIIEWAAIYSFSPKFKQPPFKSELQHLHQGIILAYGAGWEPKLIFPFITSHNSPKNLLILLPFSFIEAVSITHETYVVRTFSHSKSFFTYSRHTAPSDSFCSVLLCLGE